VAGTISVISNRVENEKIPKERQNEGDCAKGPGAKGWRKKGGGID